MVSESPPGAPVPALEQFLRAAAPGLLSGPLEAELLSGGRSNLTYLLTDGRERWVLRRPPLGHVLATAHDMDREYRMLSALHPTEVPVPRPVVSAGPDVIGAPFYVMEFADGVVLRESEQLAGFAGRAKELAVELVDVLARLHSLDPAAVGLGDLGRPDGYLDRQLRRWAKQLDASHTRDLPDLVRLGEKLGHSVPSGQTPSIVHGDYRLDNVVVSPLTGQVVSVLDWEMATLGDPLTDLASMIVWWDGIAGLDSPVAAVPGETPGFPGSGLLIDRYAEHGRDLRELAWYLGFAYYKIAVIFEGIHFRAQQGLTVGEGFDRLGELVPALTGRGHAALQGRRTAL
ncbi:phosphotransferase family protein [Amycolatopsis acidicola]|uniref:Phosphotransferase family protein n=1 Tax=Amycolatopsis acidicola TaxID=2596893 RepID=A0A5N0URF9_9PSEU|nr:phosphotransferase family protein [Amycolatopsis acidicola]KAA9151851.1 phosphotransferase family protein [Amycolatopsis acidicola]